MRSGEPNDLREIIDLCDRVKAVLDNKPLTLQMDVYANMISVLAGAAAAQGYRPEQVIHAIKKNALRFARDAAKDAGVKIPRN